MTRRRRCFDQDIFRFTGAKGETVTLTLAPDPDTGQTSQRATLLLTDQIAGVFFARLDSGALPNTVQATLPATGAYWVTVAEHPDLPRGSAFLGAYCVTLESSAQAWETFTTTATVEGARLAPGVRPWDGIVVVSQFEFLVERSKGSEAN